MCRAAWLDPVRGNGGKSIQLLVAEMTVQPTTLSARDHIAPKRPTLRQQVLDYIANLHEFGATDEEIQRHLEMAGSTQRPRRQELQEMGLLKDSGMRRKTLAGRDAIVWVVRENEVTDKQKTLF